MGLKGISFNAVGRRSGEYLIGEVISAGQFLRLGSENSYLQLASVSEVTHVAEWDVTATGIEDVDILKGVEVKETQVHLPARVLQLQPGDMIYTNQLASGSDTGAVDGTHKAGQALSFFSGKARVKQTADSTLARIAALNGANHFDTDGYVWIEIVALNV